MRSLTPFGITQEKADVRDGSGLSHETTISAEAFTNFLYHIQSAEWFPSCYESLPIAGEADRMIGGTLHELMDGIDVHAITGTIVVVSSLSVYITSANRKKYIVSILLNNVHGDQDENIKEVEDEIIRMLDNA